MSAKPIARLSALMAAAAMLAGTALVHAPYASASDTKSAKSERARRICRTVTPSGSRLTTRICRTQAEWDEGQDKTQDGLLQFQMKEQTTYQMAPPS